MLYKRYVDVVLMQKKSGDIIPLYVCWDNGRKYKIDKIIDKGRSVSSVGGCGMRYTCMIGGQAKRLYLEKDKWFIESAKP